MGVKLYSLTIKNIMKKSNVTRVKHACIKWYIAHRK